MYVGSLFCKRRKTRTMYFGTKFQIILEIDAAVTATGTSDMSQTTHYASRLYSFSQFLLSPPTYGLVGGRRTDGSTLGSRRSTRADNLVRSEDEAERIWMKNL